MPAIRLTSSLGALVCVAALAAGPVNVTVDFGTSVDYPLTKSKFGLFDSGMVRPDRYARDAATFGPVRPESMRVDVGWGAGWIGWKRPAIFGTASAPQFDFAEMDATATTLRTAGVPVYWSYCYTPRPLQPGPGRYTAMPTDVDAYGKIIGAVVAHYRDLPGGDPVEYHEIGNEPDNRDFFTGSRDDYLKLYDAGSKAVREADPDAMVGGPALAFSADWVDPFLSRVVNRKLPLDFFSFHYYPGVPSDPRDLAGWVRRMETALDRRPSLRTTELHLNEFNSFPIDYPRGGKQDRAPMAVALLHDVAWLVEQPGLTRVHWAQFLDSGGGNFSGMVTTDGRRKAIYNAFLAYMAMPVDRCALTADSADVEGLASAADGEAGVLLWNRGRSPRAVLLHLRSLPFTRGTVSPIDADHASVGDRAGHEAMTAELFDGSDGARVELPADGVVWLRFGKVIPERLPAGRVIRERHDYPDRTARAYADVDRRTWTIRMGSGGQRHAGVTAGLTAVGLSGSVDVVTKVGGMDGGTVAVRVDFVSPAGHDKSVVYYRAGDRPPADVPPWGTGRPADSFVAVIDPGRFRISAPDGPADWAGRADVTVMMRNAGPTARVVFKLRPTER